MDGQSGDRQTVDIRERYRVNQDPDNIIPRIRNFCLDMDGTVYLDSTWIDGAKDFLAALTATGRTYCFMTNNSSKSAGIYVEKLLNMGLVIDPETQLKDFHSLCINVPESQLVRSLLILEQHAHGAGRNLPSMPRALQAKVLTDREIEVLSLIVQGYINKEIADRLNIGLTTVITHRKNIMDKLGLKSVSALTIYAVMHGYVDINKI